MFKKVAKIISVVLAVMFSFVYMSCDVDNRGPGDIIDSAYQWATTGNYDGTAVMDSSAIANYSGANKDFELIAWNTKGSGNYKTYASSEDVVSPEIKRITGVSINKKDSFDNKGNTAASRYNNLLTTGQKMHIAYGTDWLEKEDVWDLTDLVDEYCPTIKARMPSYVWNNENVNGGQKGKVYGIPYGLYSISLTAVDPLADIQKSIMFSHLNDSCPYVLVREDILKDAYPQALTTADIDRIYAEQGYFTEEQLFDVDIKSAREFREVFLPKIKKAINDGGEKYEINANRKVTPMLVTAGSDYDTWDFMGKLVPYLVGGGANSMNTNMSYWDVSTQKIESMLYQDFYKNEVYEWAKMVNNGTIVSKTGMTTVHSTLQSELNSGYYAVGYLSSSMPSGNVCTWKGERINYRKVYLNIPVDTSRFMYCGFGEAVVNSVKFFKDEINRDELAQLLRWLDFQCSRTADKLFAWGPDGANALFNTDQETGMRTYKDSDLDNQMVFSTAMMGDKVQKYSLSNGTVEAANAIFPFYYQAGSIYHPKSTYDLSSLTGLASSYYSSAAVLKDKQKEFVGLKLNPSIHVWTDSNLSGIKAVWGKRLNIEDDLKQLLIAGSSQSTFDTAWGKLQTTLTGSGWTKSYFNGKVTNAFLTINKDYLDKFYED